ncbi:ABC transporter ATP-binding protein [Weizmannia coagulans]|jgi:ABC-2 type transport system ATP-binding protein|uniref:ABC transporter-like protein n=3 Tax=Heyndrickxia TaxID=2837504 RepID=A0A0C5CK28_HEYCO|nr:MULTISPECIES: ABC transporter ATP-binding protein [Heyndrickxia]AEP01269.1 ABC transporter related protein [Heyndrickxia coagulans 36D1]AJO21727.1 ABC transporter-like protein [Heyndrickxia coagulans]AKN52647.1 ABC transporter, ATP-binding protein [Heyndrickxia coagulans]APB37087.1 ABC transporter ATP-binding protein [Heyndrickxia coagulans]ATW82221.1 ABC transporter ATP-binding protein [Heyndrickxia coagulans]
MIEIKNIKKRFDKKIVLRGLSLEIKDGDFFGILGTNGVGKTTLLKIIAGMMVPDSGEVTINGEKQDIKNYALQNLIGFVPDHAILYEYLTGEEYLYFVGGMFNVPKKKIVEFAANILNDFELYNEKDQLIKTYSHGMKQKISIAAALIHEPQILILDEPLTGIDLKSSKVIRKFLKDYTDKGKTVLITTHLLELAHSVCNQIAIIHEGKLARKITVQDYSLDKLEEEVENIYV